MKDRSPRYRKALFRLAAGVATWLVLVGNVAGYLHHATVRHAICREHGHPIHLVNGPQDRPGLRLVHGPDGQPSLVWLQPPPESPQGHHHEHCPLCLTSRQRVGVTTAAVADLAYFCTPQPSSLQDFVAPSSGIAPYVIAPKHSPPV